MRTHLDVPAGLPRDKSRTAWIADTNVQLSFLVQTPDRTYLITVQSYRVRKAENDIANNKVDPKLLRYSGIKRDQLASAVVSITKGVGYPVLGTEKNQKERAVDEE